jgi:hypothetical protein
MIQDIFLRTREAEKAAARGAISTVARVLAKEAVREAVSEVARRVVTRPLLDVTVPAQQRIAVLRMRRP